MLRWKECKSLGTFPVISLYASLLHEAFAFGLATFDLTECLQLNRTYDAHMFYFFFESRSLKADDPVVLWMTGKFSSCDL